MDLIEQKREEHRSRIMQRVGSVLVCLSFLLATVFQPIEARAVVVADDLVVAAAVSAFLSACGMSFSASGMESNDIKQQVGVLIDQYLAEAYNGISSIDWFDGEGEAALNYRAGKLIFPAEKANKVSDFAKWVRTKYNVISGSSVVSLYYVSAYSVQLLDGSSLKLSCKNENFKEYASSPLSYRGYMFNEHRDEITEYNFASGSRLEYIRNTYYFYDQNRRQVWAGSGKLYETTFVRFTDGHIGFCSLYYGGSSSSTDFMNNVDLTGYFDVLDDSSSFELIPSETLSIPETITNEREIVIVTGAGHVSLDDALTQILDAIAAGQLSTTKAIAEAGATEAAAAEEEAFPDVGELGLPALGETLTTRFPFSIPWDVVRAIRLLAAPAKTPRFEVDFFAPVRYRFGGSLGDTTVVLDFSEYEIIGQVSRWASTIGFCLLLASGTKKLIWTA